MDVGDVLPSCDRSPHSLMDRAKRRAPADHRQLCPFAAEADLLLRNRVGDAQHLGKAGVGHLLMDFGAVIDVAGPGLLFDAADAVLKTRRARLDPRTCE